MSTADMMRAIADECRRLGVAVAAVPDWETRGLGPLTPRFVIVHHTAAERDVTNLLLHGRADLRGPLCNIELRKDGTVVLVAARRANHAGVGVVGSSESYGIEATGPVPTGATGAKAFPQYEAYIKLCAAIRRVHGWGSDHIVAHKETARPIGRKVDPFFDMQVFRAQVSMALATAPPGALQEDDLPYTEDQLKTIIRGVLNEGTARGQASWAGTSKAQLHTAQTCVNEIRAAKAEIAALRSAIAKAGTGTLDPRDIAQAAYEGAVRALAETKESSA